MKKQNHEFSLWDITKAGSMLLPYLPKLLIHNRDLISANANMYKSTGQIFEHMAARQPRHPFLLFEQKSWSYAKFNAWVNRIANVFKSKDIGSGDCVAIMFENSPELLACTLATNKLGAIAGMINHHQRGEVLQHSLNLIKPRLLIFSASCQDHLKSLDPQLNSDLILYYYDDTQTISDYPNLAIESARQSATNLIETQQVKLGQKCFYIFTSGTTGLPKAAAMTHQRWYKAGLGMGLIAMRLIPKDVMYCPLPLYHNNALTVALSSVVTSGATLALTKKFSVNRFWDDINFYKATSFIYIGELCRYLLNVIPRSSDRKHEVRVVVDNGVRPEIWEEFQERFGIQQICEFYGASENSTAFVNILNLKRTAGLCPMSYAIVQFDPEQEIPLFGQDGFMRKAKRGDSGLLLTEVTQNHPFEGYSESKSSKAKLLHNVFKKGDCWFNTGDLVRDQGFRHVAFVDRVGDTYRWKGENIASTEVEGVVKNFRNVTEAVVYGVKIPHTDGRAGMVAITLEKGFGLNINAFYQFIKEKLPHYAIPLFIRVRHSQEITSTFKIKKTDLKRESFMHVEGGDQIYILIDRQKGYQTLSQDIIKHIETGQLRF
ncbi:long-chain-acyl-CoA synthetase [Acinetobacter guillouiae]|uniref:long-chain-acyl-CoA synthetase n=1 Tax=Acinetobacter guillouiae TaxID=106649 RepID=UPI002FDB638D